jgi:hypothetical protein
MVHIRTPAFWRKMCVYLIIIFTTISMMCMILINKNIMIKTPETAFTVIRVPLKDTLKKHANEKPFANVKISLKEGENGIIKNKASDGKHNSVSDIQRNQAADSQKKAAVKIDKRLLTMIEEIEQSDTTIKGKVAQRDFLNFTCPPKLRIIDGVEDLLCMVRKKLKRM